MSHEIDEQGAGPGLRPLAADRYADYEVAGEGGMGIVYLALDTDLNRQVAFKIVRPSPVSEETPTAPSSLSPPAEGTPASQAFGTLKARFLQEAWVTAGLEHSGIVPVYELGRTEEGVPYYTMRFVRGSRSLADAIVEAVKQEIDARLALLEPFLKVCDTIRYAHDRGVIHRDLKPENIALGEYGEVVVLDWGLAKMRDAEDVSGASWRERIREYREAADLQTLASAMGTPGYMSPEAALGRVEIVDERSDVYSLGAMLFEVLTGRLPFVFESYFELVKQLRDESPPLATSLVPSAPEALSAICAKALATDHEERYSGAGELAEAIRTWQRESALEREMAALAGEAEAAFGATEGLTGEALLKQLDRVTGVCSRILHRVPDHPRARELTGLCGETRERAIRERVRSTRATILRRVAAAALIFAVAGAALFAWFVEVKRRETEEARSTAVRERDAKSRALRRSRALALANASALAAGEDAALSLLLARQAARIELLPEVVSRLHVAVSNALERSLIRAHGSAINSIDLSPSGDRILTASSDGTARVFRLTGEEVTALTGTGEGLSKAIFSPGGDRIATAGESGTVRVVGLDGEELAALEGHEGGVRSLEFSPNGDLVLTSSDAGTVRLWNLDGRVLLRLEGRCATIHPAGDRILTGGADRSAHLFTLDGEEIAAYRGHETGSTLTQVVFSPSGDMVLTTSSDGTARLSEISGRERAVLRSQSTPIHARFDPTGERVLILTETGRARLFGLDGEQLADLPGGGFLGLAPVFSSSGARLLTSDSRTGIVWDVRGRRLASLVGHDGIVTSAVFLPSGDRVVTGSEDGTLRIWDTVAGESLVLHVPEPWMLTVQVSDAGERILTGSVDLRAVKGFAHRLWDLEGNVEPGLVKPSGGRVRLGRDRLLVTTPADPVARIRRLDGVEVAELRHEDPVTMASFSPTGERILTVTAMGVRPEFGEYRSAVHVWDPEGRRLARFPLPGSQYVGRASLSPDEGLVLAALSDGTARAWDLEGNERLVLGEHFGLVSEAIFSPTGTRVATSDEAGFVRLWDIAGREIAAVRRAGSSSLAFTPDGERVVIGSQEATRIWDPSSGALETVEGGLPHLSPAGDVLLTVKDAVARLWDIEGRPLAVLEGHRDRIRDAAFLPDGSAVVTASLDGTARLWWVRAERLLRLADERLFRDFSVPELRRYADLLGDENPEFEARRIVDALFEELVLKRDVLERLGGLEGIREDVRTEALDLAGARDDTPYVANAAAWRVVRSPGDSADAYRRALRWARAAHEMLPSNLAVLNTLGVARYRAGEYEAALETLREVDSRNAVERSHPRPTDLIFISMSLMRLGKVEEARIMVAEARDLLEASKVGGQRELYFFLFEAERLIGSAKDE